MAITWADRVTNLRKALGREPTLDELLDVAQIHQMTPAEIEAQRQSLGRALSPCEHGIFDFEECPECRKAARKQ